MLDPAAVAANLARIREQVGPEVEILAATKYVDADDLPALHEAGITLVGENRSDALAAKQAAHAGLFTWDFIGHVQSRKVRDIVGRVRLIHAVDSLSACSQIQGRSAEPAACLLQVNVAGEDTKAGVGRGDVDAFLDEVEPLEHVVFHGLMTMPPFTEDPEESRPHFAALRELAQRHGLEHLSMGTSQDYAVAVEEGATIVRIGSVLFE